MRDDRGQEVEVLRRVGFCACPIAGDRRIGVMRARLGAIRENRVRDRVLLVAAAIVFISLVFGAIAGLLHVMGPTIWMLALEFVVLGLWAWGLGHVMFRLRRRRCGEGWARELLREGLCASCGYNLVGSEVEPDGCVVCAECSAAWRVDRMRRREPFAAGARMSDSVDAMLMQGKQFFARGKDARGEAFVVPRMMLMGREKPEEISDDPIAVERVRKAMKKRRLLESSVVAGLAVSVMGVGLLARVVEPVVVGGVEIPWVVVALGVGLIVLGLVINRVLLRSRKVVTVRSILGEGLCPACLSSLRGARVGEDGARECGWCGAAWREGGKDESVVVG